MRTLFTTLFSCDQLPPDAFKQLPRAPGGVVGCPRPCLVYPLLTSCANRPLGAGRGPAFHSHRPAQGTRFTTKQAVDVAEVAATSLHAEGGWKAASRARGTDAVTRQEQAREDKLHN